MTDRDFALAVMKAALRAGADGAEVAVSRTLSTTITILKGAPDIVSAKETAGFGVRFLRDHRMAFAASNRFDLANADSLVESLAELVKEHTPEDANVIPENLSPNGWDASFDIYDDDLAATTLDAKLKRSLAIEKHVLGIDPRIVAAGRLGYGDGAGTTTLVNSNGVEGTTRDTLVYSYLQAIGRENGSTETGMDLVVSKRYAGLDTEKLARTAAHRALRLLGSKPGRSAELPLVVPPEVGGDILDYTARMFDADAVQKGKSLFRGRENTQVAAEIVTLLDDGRYPDGLATSYADGEGIPTGRTELIRNGTLVGFLHDCYTAAKANTRSTGNAQRGSYRSLPSVGPTNFLLSPGEMTEADLMAGIEEGFYITDTQGLHAAVNPVSGDFSIPCKGLMIRAGELAEPVAGVAISGNLFDLLKDVDAIGREIDWTYASGMIGAPAFRVKSVKIGSGD